MYTPGQGRFIFHVWLLQLRNHVFPNGFRNVIPLLPQQSHFLFVFLHGLLFQTNISLRHEVEAFRTCAIGNVSRDVELKKTVGVLTSDGHVQT